MGRFTGVLGLLTMLGLAYLFSTNRRAIKLKMVIWGLSLQIAFAFLVFYWTFGQMLFFRLGNGVNKLLAYAFEGSEFVFGELGKQQSSIGFIFAFQVLPTIIFIASLFALLYYLGVMQVVIRAAAWVMQRVMGASGAESLNVAASIFMGQTEAPLTIRPFLPDLTQSELMTIMTSGMAHVSGGIMAAYIAFGVEARHLLTAVIMTAPGTLLISKMLVPETEQPKTMGVVHMENVEHDSNFLAAIARGTSEGLGMAINVGAMLIAFLALIALTNGILGGIHNFLGGHGMMRFPSSLQQIFGWAFAPVAFIIGVPWHDCVQIGNLLGTRMVVNELVAFSMLGPMKGTLDPRSFTIATFALCGFANFSFDWNANRGHRRARAESEIAAGEIRHPRDARRDDGEPDVRLDCGDVFEMSASAAAKTKPSQEFVRAEAAAKFILAKTKLRPRIGLVLGSGLGAFANEIAGAARIEYKKIPHFPRSTAIGHAGRMVIGKVADVPVAVMQGRVHFYEGYSHARSDFSDARDGPHGNPRRSGYERRGRNQSQFQARVSRRSARSHQSSGHESFDRAERRAFRRALSRHDAGVLEAVPGGGAAGRQTPRHRNRRGRVRGAHRAELRNAGGNSLLAHDWRGPRRDVHRAGSDCRRAPGNSGAGNFLRNEHGRRDSRSADYDRGSHGNRRAREGGFCGPVARRDSAHE